MSSIVIVYFSGYGHTKRIAQAVAEGANASLIEIDAEGNLTAEQWEQIDQAKALIMGSPTYMGMVAWQFKKFADASSKAWFNKKWHNKVAGGFTISASMSGDKLSTLQYFVTLAMQHGMIWVGQIESNEYKITDGKNRLGSFTGLMAQCGPQDPATEIPQGDIDTAVAYGHRIAIITQQLNG